MLKSKKSKSSKGPRRDLHAEVTAKIIEALEQGVVPWVRPWSTSGGPCNAATGRPYSGVNVLLLTWAQLSRGYEHSLWLTFKQAKALGGTVRKGEKGSMVTFTKFLELDEGKVRPRPNDRDDRDADGKRIPLLKQFTVFNIDQCDLPCREELLGKRLDVRELAARNQVCDSLIERFGAEIV